MLVLAFKVKTNYYIKCVDCGMDINDDYCAELVGIPSIKTGLGSHAVIVQFHTNCAHKFAEDMGRIR